MEHIKYILFNNDLVVESETWLLKLLLNYYRNLGHQLQDDDYDNNKDTEDMKELIQFLDWSKIKFNRLNPDEIDIANHLDITLDFETLIKNNRPEINRKYLSYDDSIPEDIRIILTEKYTENNFVISKKEKDILKENKFNLYLKLIMVKADTKMLIILFNILKDLGISNNCIFILFNS